MKICLKGLRHFFLVRWLRNILPNKLVNIFWHLPLAFLATLVYRFPSRKLKIIGVTGTDGKTTTATLIADILKKAGKKVGLITTVSASIGNKKVATGLHVTNPNPWKLQSLLRESVNNKLDFVLLEVTSHGLAQNRVFGVSFDIAAITNVTKEHLDYHKTWVKYLKAKAKLFKNVNYKILNKDDKSFEYLQRIKKGEIISYSLNQKANVTADNIQLGKAITSFEYTYQDKFGSKEKQEIQTSLIGKFNVSNILAAIGIAKALGIDKNLIKKGVKDFQGIEGRMQEVKTNKDFKIFIDFAHTPNAMENALLTLKNTYHPNNLIVVFGCAGLRDKHKRPEMGKIACKIADEIVLTAEDPRTEDLNKINQQILTGCKNKDKVIKENDRQKAIEIAINQIAKKDDIVAILGKGHEESLCIGRTEHSWSDLEAVKKVLKNNG